MNKKLPYLILLFLAIVAVLMVWSLFFFNVSGSDILQIHNATTNKQTYFVGDPVYLTIDGCKLQPAQGTLQYVFVNHFSFSLTPRNTGAAVGCGKATVTIAEVPIFFEEGIYHIHGNVQYKLSYGRIATYEFDSNNFTVVKRA